MGRPAPGDRGGEAGGVLVQGNSSTHKLPSDCPGLLPPSLALSHHPLELSPGTTGPWLRCSPCVEHPSHEDPSSALGLGSQCPAVRGPWTPSQVVLGSALVPTTHALPPLTPASVPPPVCPWEQAATCGGQEPRPSAVPGGWGHTRLRPGNQGWGGGRGEAGLVSGGRGTLQAGEGLVGGGGPPRQPGIED